MLSRIVSSIRITAIRSNSTSFPKEMACSKEVKVTHHPENHQFVAEIEGTDERAYVDYMVMGKTWDLQHTLVPEAFRGQGVGAVLAKFTFDHIVKEDLKMKLTCSYLEHFADKNPLPEYKERIVE